jgi:death-on-curing family protein
MGNPTIERGLTMSQVEIYRSLDKQTQVEVKFEEESVWLNQKQLSELFGRDRVAITQHLGNIFKEKELVKKAVCKKFLHTAEDGKNYDTMFYNLDVIISVGYRVKSKRGTQFRQWATQRLKDHLVKGYSINQKRLDQLQQTIQLIEKSGQIETLSLPEAKGLLEIISNYTQSFILLNRFDNQTLQSDQLNENVTYEIEYKEALSAIAELKKQLIQKKEASELFGKQKDDSFAGILGNVVQSFGGEYLYKSIEEQAAHLLYFIIKNHPFTDGNKRIGAFLFIWFLEKNRHRFKKSGELKINDNALVALALLVAQCNPADKEVIIKLIINLIRS